MGVKIFMCIIGQNLNTFLQEQNVAEFWRKLEDKLYVALSFCY